LPKRTITGRSGNLTVCTRAGINQLVIRWKLPVFEDPFLEEMR